MLDEKLEILIATIQKLYRRGARSNIQKVLSKSHTADIAAVMNHLVPELCFEVFQLEKSVQRQAEILSYASENIQKELLHVLPQRQFLDLLALMDKDDAADLLGHLNDEEAKEILAKMKAEHSEEVADLLAYPEDSAGGLMSSEYLSFEQTRSVKDVVLELQQKQKDQSVSFYIYVVNRNGHLIGVMSLKQLLLNQPETLLRDIMQTDVISVRLNESAENVARTVERYDFLSIPVVDDSNKMMGVITVDDVIDVIREEAEENLLAMGRAGWEVDASFVDHLKARLPWLILAFCGGIASFAMVNSLRSIGAQIAVDDLWFLLGFLPVLLAVGGTTGSQAVTVSVATLRSGLFEKRKYFMQVIKESQLSLVFASLFAVLSYGGGVLVFGTHSLGPLVAAVLFAQIIVAVWVGTLLPLAFYRMGIDPTVSSIPVFTAVADVSAIALLLVGLNWL